MKGRSISQNGFLLVLSAIGILLVSIALAQGPRVFWQEAAKEPAVVFNSPPSFAPIADKVIPAVVTVYTTRTFNPSQFEPGQFFFFFGPGPHKEKGMGSGFILTPDGYILTNNHVVEGAEVIKVEIGDKDKKRYDARKVGSDEKVDIALIKIEAKNLPTVVLGDSDQVVAGDWVMAIGSPFQFPHTVTAGIVSARARHLGGPYDDFLQTDASINPGNSGGPLVNMRGEVVGINSIIISPSMGNVGLGFSIPIKLVKALLPELKETGKVVRSWLGVNIQDLTPELAESFGLKETKGVLITQVSKDSPADKGGLEKGDIILEVGGKPAENESQLRGLISGFAPGSKVGFKTFRSGQVIERAIALEMRPEPEKVSKTAVQKPGNIIGVKVTDLTPQKALALNYDTSKGSLVVSVSDQSPLADILVPNDLIIEVNGTEIGNAKSFNDLVAKLKTGDLVRIQYQREKYIGYYAFRVL